MEEITGEKGAMWGDAIVGYGSYHYVYASGRKGDWMATGFASRKQALTIYIMAGFKRYDDLMARLGKFKTGSSCLYVKKLEDIDLNEKDVFHYLFDFGDDWWHRIRVQSIRTGGFTKKLIKVIKSVGRSPGQYPDYDDYEDQDYD